MDETTNETTSETTNDTGVAPCETTGATPSGQAAEAAGPTMRLAVPTQGRPGLGAQRSAHFGHCDCFTVVDIENGQVTAVHALQNPPHEEGGCLRPVNLLAGVGATAIVAAGMGMRPLMGFTQAGITVYFDNRTPRVGDVVQLVAAGKVPTMTTDEACNHHH